MMTGRQALELADRNSLGFIIANRLKPSIKLRNDLKYLLISFAYQAVKGESFAGEEGE